MAANVAPSRGAAMNYHLLASLMSLQPDFAIFRRFLQANARDLLRLQGEIIDLESDLEVVAAADRASDDLERAAFDFSVATLKGPHHPSSGKGRQWETQVELGHKLSEYRTALLQYKQLCELPSANKLCLTNLRKVLHFNGGGRGFPRDEEHTTWCEENEVDLTSLTGRYQKMDVFSRWVDSKLLGWYHNKLGHRLHDPISLAESGVKIPVAHYSDGKLAIVINALSTILSSLLPTMSIFALYYIPHPVARMAAIVVFSLLFSVILTLIAKARRIDCFAATTAFAAVQVVFVGTAINKKQV